MIDRSRFRTRSIGVKVTEADFDRLKQLAEADGKPMGEWCREVLLTVAAGGKPSVTDRILLSEVLALRTLLLNALFALAGGETLSAEEMNGLIERADQVKLGQAAALLEDPGEARR